MLSNRDRKTAKEWAHNEVVVLIEGILDIGNTLINNMDDNDIRGIVGVEGDIREFSELVDLELEKIKKELSTKTGQYF